MSGQAVTLPVVDAPTIETGGVSLRRTAVGILDTSGFSPELADVDGFLSLAFFAEAPFTVDHARGVVVAESPGSLEERVRDGTAVAARIRRDGPSIDAFLRLDLPGGRTIEVEIDMGSDSLILDQRLASEVGGSTSTAQTSAASKGATRPATATRGTSRDSRARSA